VTGEVDPRTSSRAVRSTWLLPVAVAAIVVAEVLMMRSARTGSGTPMVTRPDGRVDVPVEEAPIVSAEGRRAVDRVRGRFAVDDRQAVCVGAALDRHAEVRTAMAEDHADERQLGEVATIVGRCVSRTAMADQFAVNIADQVGGLDQEHLACLRDGYAGWTAEQQGQLVGGTAADARLLFDDLLARCSVDRGRLRAP
jgi:hypothetical protein